ncbi:erbin, partial [Tachysurus ichikawai]
EGNLRRYPTPYPDELKNMVKTAQSVAHRLREDESGDETAGERNHIGVQSVGVKVSTHTYSHKHSYLHFINIKKVKSCQHRHYL